MRNNRLLPYETIVQAASGDDTDHSVCEAYGVWAEKSMYGRKYMGVLRTTFVIDAEGRIEKVFTKVDTANHYRQILDAYK